MEYKDTTNKSKTNQVNSQLYNSRFNCLSLFVVFGSFSYKKNMFIDIHTHKSGDPEYSFIQNLTFPEAEIVFSSNKNGFYSVGFHPWTADEFTEELFLKLEKYTVDKRLITIGECGLDKNSTVSFEKQIFVFERQIELSEKAKKPLIIHCVGYFNELFELKKRLNPSQLWILHGFRAKPELAKQALKAGCAFSFGEFFNAESVRIIPIDKLFIETDESLLSIEEIYTQIARIKDIDPHLLTGGEVFVKKTVDKFSIQQP